MTVQTWESCALAALHHGLVMHIVPEARTDAASEAMRGILRIIARLRAERDVGPPLAMPQLARWRGIRAQGQSVLADSRQAAVRSQAVVEVNPYADLCAELEDTRLAVHETIRTERGLEPFTRVESPQSAWFREATGALLEWMELYEAGLSSLASKESCAADSSEEFRAALSRYLESRFEGLPRDCVRQLRIVAGGRSKETAIFELASNPILPQRLVIRRDRDAGGLTKTSVAAEYPILRRLHSRGVPVPVPVLAEADAGRLGGTFMITEEVVDATKGGEPFAELIEFGRLHSRFPYELARALAQQHSIHEWPKECALGGYGSEVSEPHQRVQHFFALWSRTTKPSMSLATDLGFAWLLSHPLNRARPRCVIHGDLGMHNILLRQGHLAAILDWELSHLGDPSEDIGNIRAALLQHLIPWRDFVDAYVSEGGNPAACDIDAVMYHSIWAHVRGSVYVALMREMVLEEGHPDLEYASIGADFFARTQLYIGRELCLVQEMT